MKTKSTRGLRFALAVAPLALALVCGPVGVSSTLALEAVMTAPATSSAPLSSIGQDDVLFTAMGRDWTRGQFEASVRFFPPPSLRIINELEIPFDRVTSEQVHSAIGEVVTNLRAAKVAEERGIEIPAEANIDQYLDDIAIRMWLREQGVMKASNITDEDVVEFREKNTAALTVEEVLQLRTMFFPTYDEVTVEEGDTLMSISERVNGDPQKASHILYLATREPRAGENAHEIGKTEPDEPLTVGEILLVPMNEEKAAEVEVQAKAAWQRVVDGESFIEVAREATGNPGAAGMVTVKPAGDAKPMLAPLREAFDSVGNGEFSEPVRTRHGFQIVYRESHQEPGLLPLDQVRRRHTMDIREAKAFEAYMAGLKRVWKEADAFEINEEALVGAGKDASEMDVILTIDGVEYQVYRLLEEFPERLAELETFEERRDLLVEARWLQRPVMMWDIERQQIRESEDFKLAEEIVRATLLTPIVIEEVTEERLEQPTDEELRKRFENDGARFTNIPSAFVWRISVTADTDEEPGTEEYRNAVRRKMMELSQTLAGIEDVTEFEKIARELSEDEFSSMGGRVGRVNSFQQEGYYKDVIDRMQGRGTVGPVIKGRDIQGYWVEEVFDTSETAFQDVRHLVLNNEMTERRIRIGRLAELEFQKEAELEIHFDPAADAPNGEDATGDE